MRGEIWGYVRIARRFDFLGKDDCETGKGDQDQEEAGGYILPTN